MATPNNTKYVIAKDNGFLEPITYFCGLVEDEPAIFAEEKIEPCEFCSCLIPCATRDCNCEFAEVIDFMMIAYQAFNYNELTEPSFANCPIAGVA